MKTISDSDKNLLSAVIADPDVDKSYISFRDAIASMGSVKLDDVEDESK